MFHRDAPTTETALKTRHALRVTVHDRQPAGHAEMALNRCRAVGKLELACAALSSIGRSPLSCPRLDGRRTEVTDSRARDNPLSRS